MFGAPQTFILFAANFPTVMVVHRQPSFGFWLWLTLEKVGACLKAVSQRMGSIWPPRHCAFRNFRLNGWEEDIFLWSWVFLLWTSDKAEKFANCYYSGSS